MENNFLDLLREATGQDDPNSPTYNPIVNPLDEAISQARSQSATNETPPVTKEFVEHNSWVQDEDGTSYGWGEDDNLYAFTGSGDNFEFVDPEIWRNEVEEASGGKIVVGPSITNPMALKRIRDAVIGVKDLYDGAFLPTVDTKIYDGDIDTLQNSDGLQNAEGYYYRPSYSGWAGEIANRLLSPHNNVVIHNSDEALVNDDRLRHEGDIGWHPKGDSSNTVTHELGHAIEREFENIPERRGPNSLLEQLRLAQEMAKPNTNEIWDNALAEAGLSEEEAAASISGYAQENRAEAFAEAFSDVVANGTNASPFSQAIISAYGEKALAWLRRLDEYRQENPFEREVRAANLEAVLRQK